MREFNLEDTFLLSDIIDKTEIEIDLNAFMDAKKDGNAAYLGGQIVLGLVKKLHKAKTEIMTLIASLTGDDIEMVKKYNIVKMKEVFTELFNHPDFKSFFSNAEDSTAKN